MTSIHQNTVYLKQKKMNRDLYLNGLGVSLICIAFLTIMADYYLHHQKKQNVKLPIAKEVVILDTGYK